MWGKRLSEKQKQGQAGEQAALAHLQRHGLALVEANFSCKGGEIDLVMRDGATLVFVEVRQRQDMTHGGAAASIGPAKIRRLVRAAQVMDALFLRQVWAGNDAQLGALVTDDTPLGRARLGRARGREGR